MVETPFGELLREYRIAAGLTQEELAERAGVSSRGISDLERGARGLPRKDTLQLLLDALDLSQVDRAALVTAARRPPAPPSSHGQSGRLPALPVPLTPLIGREAEIAAVSDLLRDPAIRLVTLSGAGGTGKTRLALAVAERLGSDFPDGVVFVSLAPLGDPSFVASAIVQQLGLREGAGPSLLERLKGHLAGKHLLLVLDNFEHLLPAAPVVSELLGGCPGVTVLVTSRVRLQLRGEREVLVPPLALPDDGQTVRRPDGEAVRDAIARSAAVRLFVARGQDVKADFALTDENAPAVAEICQRLDGLPLALELAAARVKILSPAALVTRLDRRLPLLTGGAQDLPDRQRTLRNTIAWSHDLLGEEERILFRRLSVFAGGWTLEGAEAVASGDEGIDVLEGISSLVDKNLVRHVDEGRDEPRFTMLETIREFALEQLHQDRGEADAVGRAHAAWYLSLATASSPRPHGVGGPVSLEASLNRLTSDYDNLRVALAWFSDRHDAEALAWLTGTLAWFWHWIAYGPEGVAWIERALSMRADASPETRMELLTGAAVLLARVGDHERATALSEELLTLAQETHNHEGEASALFLLSRAANQRGASAEAMALAEKAVALFRALKFTAWLPWALRRLGIEAHIAGDFERAAALHTEALEWFRSAGNTLGTAYALGTLGFTQHRLGERRQAAALFRESLTLHRELTDPWETASVLGQLAALVAEYGHAERVSRLLGATRGLCERAGAILQPYIHDALDPVELEVRTRLGPEAYAATWEAGRRLSLSQAIEVGLEAVTVIDEELALARSSPGGG